MNIRKPGYKKGSRGVKNKSNTGNSERNERNSETESENNAVRRRRGANRLKGHIIHRKECGRHNEGGRKQTVANTRAERSDGGN